MLKVKPVLKCFAGREPESSALYRMKLLEVFMIGNGNNTGNTGLPKKDVSAPYTVHAQCKNMQVIRQCTALPEGKMQSCFHVSRNNQTYYF